MNFEKQFSNLELSEKLRKLGVKQESLFYWNLWQGQMDDCMFQIHYGKPVMRGDGVLPETTFSAFTVAELGEMLPMKDYNFNIGVNTKLGWFIMYGTNCFYGKTEADARAKCLIYLIENGLINGYEKIPV